MIQVNLRYLARRFRKSFETITACRRLYGVESINLFRKRLMRKIDLIDVHMPVYGLHIRGDASSLIMFARAFSSLLHCGVEVYFEEDMLVTVVGGIEEYFKINPLSLEESLRLYNLALLVNFAKIIGYDNFTYTVIADGLRWIVRRYSLDDIGAPLLPYTSEPYEYSNWFKRIIGKCSVFVDVGAFLGGYTLRAAAAGALVIALEPEEENFSILLRNISENNLQSNITPLRIGAFSTYGKMPLYVQDNFYATYSLLSGNRIKGFIEVKPLDEIGEIASQHSIDLLKIDVEGAEIEVIRGAIETLRKTRYLMVETSYMRRFESLLKSLGFIRCDVEKHGTYFNVLFRRNY